MSGHTKGPWTYERQEQDNGDIYFAVHAHDYEFITNVYESEANARLVAAAPDLLAALEVLTKHDVNFRTGPEQAAARAAIKKATGA